ncbi:MAG TPA: pseudouridine synthase [Allosphingosinicella sp.]|uniref:pseudouridine synthase n=1 Tax=Allosphingosinicella sp. TaxID=2823234 RepID=UPI002ED7BC5F
MTEESLPKPPSRSAPRGTSAKQAPAKKGPKPPRGERPARPARPDRAKAEGAARPKREEAKGRPAADKRKAKTEARRGEERSSPSRMKRARLFREESAGSGRRGGETKPQSPRAEQPRPRSERTEEEPPRAHKAGEPQRIAKLLARAGVASRREVERMIAEGRIARDGAVIDTPATILTSLKGVTVDGKPVSAPAATRLFLFHKPPGFLTAAKDPAGRKTIYDRLPPGLPRLVPVGRLDLNTEGLLLLTNDGELKRQLELPSTGIERTYRARVFGDVTQERLETLIEGIEIEGMRYGPIDANLERRTGRNGWVEMKLTEGKNREVRRVLEHLGLQVSRLIRTAYGPFVLGDLPLGAVGEVPQHDLVTFRKTLR